MKLCTLLGCLVIACAMFAPGVPFVRIIVALVLLAGLTVVAKWASR